MKRLVVRRLRELETLRRGVQVLKQQLPLAETEEKPRLQRQLHWRREQVRIMETSLGVLSPEERLVVDMLDIRPARGNCDRLCQLLQVEVASVYRRRDRAIRKLSTVLYGKA